MNRKQFLLLLMFAFIAVTLITTSCDLLKKEVIAKVNNPPNAPSSPVPTDGATNVSINVLLSWVCSDPDSDPLVYDLYFGTDEQSLELKEANLTSNSYQLNNLEYSTTYYWKVVAKDPEGKETAGQVWSFTTQPHPNRAPVLNIVQPLNDAENMPLNLFLQWNASDADGDPITYDLYFGDTPNPPLIKQDISLETFQPNVEFNLSYGTYYYWKVVAKDPKGAQVSSGVLRFKTQSPPNNPPSEPSNGWPSNNIVVGSLNLTLSWSASDPDNDSLSYDIYFGTSSNPPKIVSNYRANSYNLYDLPASRTYYWRVVAKDGKGGVTFGPLWSFRTPGNSSPSVPTLINPVYGSNNEPVRGIVLIWTPSTDPDGDPIYYDLYFGTSSNPSLFAGHLYGTNYNLPKLNYNTTYYWKVVARDGKGGESSSALGRFTTLQNMAPVVTLIDPTNPSPRVNLTLRWNVWDANGDNWTADVYLGKSPSNLTKVASNLPNEESYTIRDVLAANTIYYWKVIVKDEGGLIGEASSDFTTGE